MICSRMHLVRFWTWWKRRLRLRSSNRHLQPWSPGSSTIPDMGSRWVGLMWMRLWLWSIMKQVPFPVHLCTSMANLWLLIKQVQKFSSASGPGIPTLAFGPGSAHGIDRKHPSRCWQGLCFKESMVSFIASVSCRNLIIYTCMIQSYSGGYVL